MSFSRPGLGFDENLLDELFAGIAPRLAHMRDVGRFAADLAASFDLPRADLLIRAATLHDIGYAPALHRHNYHPLDGALFLEAQGEHPWIVEGVLRHSQADRKAARVPGISEHYVRRPALDEAAWLVRAVTIADWRANGVGGRASFSRRMQDIAVRNPDKPDKIRRARMMVNEVRDDFLAWAPVMEEPGRPLPWVFCDVDNTLVSPGHGLSAENKAAVRAWVAAGGQFSLATGKHPRSILPLAEELGVSGAQIVANGTCLLENGRVVVLAHLGPQALELSARLEALGLPVALYHEKGIVAGSLWNKALSGLFDRYGEVRPEAGPLDGPVLKILCVVEAGDPERERHLRDMAEQAGVQICRSDRHFLEFVPPAGTKGQAMRLVTERSGWPLLHTLALGDSENDESFFALCGVCAAVANATDEARLGADWVIPACTEDGVGRMLDILRQGGGWRALNSALRVME